MDCINQNTFLSPHSRHLDHRFEIKQFVLEIQYDEGKVLPVRSKPYGQNVPITMTSDREIFSPKKT
jgi:hypothetical protein